jgi:hypothetical protein
MPSTIKARKPKISTTIHIRLGGSGLIKVAADPAPELALLISTTIAMLLPGDLNFNRAVDINDKPLHDCA